MSISDSEQGLVQALLAGRNIKLRVSHLHAGNSSRSKRKGKKYVTIAKILEYPDMDEIGRGVARCSKDDTPSRKVGRGLAVSRAIQDAVAQRTLRAS